MMPLRNPEQIIIETKRIVESDRRSEIRINANGGNSILIVCEPNREMEYVQAIEKLMTTDNYKIINLNEMLNEFVELNRAELEENFKLLKSSVNQVFKTPDGELGSDLFQLIIQGIVDSFNSDKIPVIIHAGALYGSDIDNIHIMENELVMRASLPLIILYPATKEKEHLMFLSKRPASKYRCMVID